MATLIFGHKNPDTDSVTSAISLSYLKNQMGIESKPKLLGKIGKETKYILDYFKVKEPKLIKDVKIQLKDLEFEDVEGIDTDTSILKAFELMADDHIKVLPVLDEKQHLKGIVSMKDVAIGVIKKNIYDINNSLESITDDLKGKILVNGNKQIDGNIKIASLFHETLQGKLNSDDVLITGDRYEIFSQAIESKIKLLIVTGGVGVPEEYLLSARENGVSIISVEQDTFTTSKLINQCNKVSTIMNTNIIAKY